MSNEKVVEVSFAENHKKWKEFLDFWPVDRVKNMSLADYSTAGVNESFSYLLERGSNEIGSIAGGSSYKFGVFNRSDKSEKDPNVLYKVTDDYAWLSKLGNSPEEAFLEIKNRIVRVIEAIESNNLMVIDQIDLWPVVKWKIAFIYQSKTNPQLVPVYKQEHLAAFIDDPELTKKMPMSKLYQETIKRINGEDILEFGSRVWNKAEAIINKNKAMKEENVKESQTSYVIEKQVTSKQPLNQILYGPPGTGKTFNTVNKALEILVPDFYLSNSDNREQLTLKFKELQESGRIGFVTFHQSFSYEDFVEGIKAKVENESVSYFIQEGIFKLMCEEAKLDSSIAMSGDMNIDGKKIWKMSLGNTLIDEDDIYEYCVHNNEVRLGYGWTIDFSECDTRSKVKNKLNEHNKKTQNQDYSVTAVNAFKNKMSIGDLVIISDGNTKFRAIGEITSDYQFKNNDDEIRYAQTRKVKWLQVYTKSLSVEQVIENNFSQMTIYELSPSSVNLAKLKALLKTSNESVSHLRLVEGSKLNNSHYSIKSISDELIRVYSENSGSVISLDMRIINELVSYIKEGKLSVEDISKKRVFDKLESKLEKYIVNGYPGIITKVVETILSTEPLNKAALQVKTSNAKRVLIIDEINRGNISSIFGELITLIEPSKRAGAKEELSAKLPYSKQEFKVPNSLHIIGTMNTADRSLALMDTALRRRFDFVEMMPNTSLLKGLIIKDIDISLMLEVMNKRIEMLYDREHTLGHAFFIPLKEASSEEQQFSLLQDIFSNKILPLLEEYFFEDWDKIRLVLGDNQKDSNQFYPLNEGLDSDLLFGNTGDYVIDDEAKVYARYSGELEPIAYKQIYAT